MKIENKIILARIIGEMTVRKKANEQVIHDWKEKLKNILDEELEEEN